jgi:hypothetical protein
MIDFDENGNLPENDLPPPFLGEKSRTTFDTSIIGRENGLFKGGKAIAG